MEKDYSFMTMCKNLFNLKGRTNRYDYWRYTLTVLFLLIILWLVLMAWGTGKNYTTVSWLLVFIFAPVLLFGTQVRRMHDIGRTVLLPTLTNISYLITIFLWAYIMFVSYDSIANDSSTMSVPDWLGFIGIVLFAVSAILCIILFVFTLKK